MEPNEIIQALEEFLTTELDTCWIIDPKAHIDGGWMEFQNAFHDCPADLLATVVRSPDEEPDWNWWSSLRSPEEESLPDHPVAALLPVMRVSRPAAGAILQGVRDGWSGHPEVLIPSLVSRAGLAIEDIGGTGSFTPVERSGRWYDTRTWHWRGPVRHVPGMLHFPVPPKPRPLATTRVSTTPGIRCPRLLYVAPTGLMAADLLPATLRTFLDAGADCLLLQYDDGELEVPEGVRVIHDKGYKFQLAIRHLHPDVVAEYDFIFFWDDDLGVNDFDPVRFARIMETNRLDMAQPSIVSPYGLSHDITKQRACPPPWRNPEGSAARPVVGRMTNFVEIMAPVYTREAWREFHGYLDAENRSGWGYDYIPLGRKGIVDVMSVVHTRAVQSINQQSERDIRSFLDVQGLFRYTPVEFGWLFD